MNSCDNTRAIRISGRVNLGAFIARRLALYKPHKVDSDEKQDNERHASKNMRRDGRNWSFIHL
jgi:hypothetical protein